MTTTARTSAARRNAIFAIAVIFLHTETWCYRKGMGLAGLSACGQACTRTHRHTSTQVQVLRQNPAGAVTHLYVEMHVRMQLNQFCCMNGTVCAGLHL